jgi:hypothetical protein
MKRMLLSWLLLAGVAWFASPGVAGASGVPANPDVSTGTSAVALTAGPHKTYWTLTMNWDGVAPTPTTYLLKPLITNGTKLSGTAKPPNTSCPGSISGTLSNGKLKLTITYPDTACKTDKAILTGTMSLSKGTTKGTFTANYHCPSTCKFSGKKTSS